MASLVGLGAFQDGIQLPQLCPAAHQLEAGLLSLVPEMAIAQPITAFVVENKALGQLYRYSTLDPDAAQLLRH